MAVFMLAFVCFSCKKNDIFSPSELPFDNLKQNEATWINPTPTKGLNEWLLKLKIFLGHTADQCGDKCIYIFGIYGHADCRGFGNICEKRAEAKLSLDTITGEYTLVILDVDVFGNDLDYPFPDRSFIITNPQNNVEHWLNVPEQVLLRANDQLPFIIDSVWFSEYQELDNN